MKSKAPLALMEQLVMLLVFALAAALCLQVFVLSDRMSQRGEARDHAVIQVQNAAETIKNCGGDLEKCAELLGGTCDETVWQIGYDAGWKQVTAGESAYLVRTELTESGDPLLGMAEISAGTADGDVLFAVTAAWQEVMADE